MEQYHETGEILEPEQKNMCFQLGAEVEGRLDVMRGFKHDPNYAHELALAALEAVDWKSLAAAKAIMTATRMW